MIDSVVAGLLPSGQKPFVHFDFEQRKETRDAGRIIEIVNYTQSVRVVVLGSLAHSDATRCLVDEALADSQNDSEMARDSFKSIAKNAVCLPGSVARAEYRMAAIDIDRGLRQDNIAMFKSANRSLDAAIPTLENTAEDKSYYYAAAIDQAFIILLYPDARLAPGDVAKAKARVEKVATALVSPNGRKEEEMGRIAILLTQKLADAERLNPGNGNPPSHKLARPNPTDDMAYRDLGQSPRQFIAIW